MKKLPEGHLDRYDWSRATRGTQPSCSHRRAQTANVVSVWFLRAGERRPRLVTVYPARGR